MSDPKPDTNGLTSTVKKLPTARVQVEVTVPENLKKIAEERALLELSKNLDIKGFRKGSVPADVAREHIKPEALQEETIRSLAPQIVTHAMEQGEEIKPIMPPKIDAMSLDPLVLAVTFVENPEVKVKKINTKDLKPTEPKVDDKDVERVINQFLQDAKTETSVNRAAKDGDTVKADFWAEDENGKEIPNTRAPGYRIEIGSNTLIPGFEDGVKGLKKGDKKDLKITFPEKYQEESLQGKPAVFHIDVLDVLEVTHAELTPELVKEKLGVEKTPEEVREDVRQTLIAQETDGDRNRRERLFFAELEKATQVELAPELLEAEKNELIHDFMHKLEAQKVSLQQWYDANKKTPEDLEKEVETMAKQRLTVQFGLRELMDKEKIEVDNGDIQEAWNARLMQTPPEQRKDMPAEVPAGSKEYEELKWACQVRKLVEMHIGEE